MLSSTFTDLKEHREAAIEAIANYGYMPRVMEFSGANAAADVIETSLQMVRDAAAYVGVIGLKYGQTPEDSGRNPSSLSITELEFNEAMRLERPIVLFIMSDDHDVKRAYIESDPAKQKKLNAFRDNAKIMRGDGKVHRVYETFESLEKFSSRVAIAIGNLARHLDHSTPTLPKPAHDFGSSPTISNIPISVPRHFLGRDEDLSAIDSALLKGNGFATVTAALHGLRGVGKTTLAAAYAERHKKNYRATWWIRAETDATIRADLVGLGVQLGWIKEEMPEELAARSVLDWLSREGQDILLVYDNAVDVRQLRSFLPRGSGPHIIITSNAPDWGGVASPVEIEVWPKEVGAEFLLARSGRADEAEAAVSLSAALGGLPLAHEQAAAYCERTGVSLPAYLQRFNNAPAFMLGEAKDASREYHDGRTVAKTFALAIEEAGKLHPAAEPFIRYLALLAPEPIPLFLFSEGRAEFGEEIAAALDEVVAVLRAFALVDRELIRDEHDPTIATDSVRLHRLVKEVALTSSDEESRSVMRRKLVAAVARAYPTEILRDPSAWPRVRRLDSLAVALVQNDSSIPQESEVNVSRILEKLAAYRVGALAAFSDARLLLERAVAIREKAFGPNHPQTASYLNNLGYLLAQQGDFAGARPYYERAIAISEDALGPDHPETAASLNNLASLLDAQGDLAGARPLYERALAIAEKAFGPDDPDTALSLNNLGYLLKQQGDLVGARVYYERALAIREKALGPDHPDTARSLNNFGSLLQDNGELVEARSCYERGLAIREKVLGSNHPDTAKSLNNLGSLLRVLGDPTAAQPLYDRALAIHEKTLGSNHPHTKIVAENTAVLLEEQGLTSDAQALRRKYGI